MLRECGQSSIENDPCLRSSIMKREYILVRTGKENYKKVEKGHDPPHGDQGQGLNQTFIVLGEILMMGGEKRTIPF